MSPILAAGIFSIFTTNDPKAIESGGPVQVAMSDTLAAGIFPIKTVAAPFTIGPPTCGTGPGFTIGQVCMSPIRAAGLPISRTSS